MREQTTMSRVLSGQKDSEAYTLLDTIYHHETHMLCTVYTVCITHTNRNKTLNETKIDFRKMLKM